MEPSTSAEAAKSDDLESFSTIAPSSMKPSNIPRSHSTSKINAPVPRLEKPPFFKRVWTKLGFSSLVVTFMNKGALAPTIATAILQRHSVAQHYLNFGYLVIVISILSVPILPRGKFTVNMIASVLLTCFACGMVALGQWAGIKARQHTTPADASSEIARGYNSSASAVNAIFLIFNIFLINTLRAFRPSLNIPSIQYTIFIMVGFVYGPQESTEASSRRFLKELLYSFLTGQAIATGVSLFIIPVSSRHVFFAEATGLLQSFRGLLKAQLEFVEALEYSTASEPSMPNGTDLSGVEETSHVGDGGSEKARRRTLYRQRATALKSASAVVLALGARMRGDVVFAKRETAYGHLKAKDIHDLHLLLRGILIPISSLSTVGDISERISNHWGSEIANSMRPLSGEPIDVGLSREAREEERGEWQELARALHGSFDPIVQVLDEGVKHVMILFKLAPDTRDKAGAQRKSDKDVSAVDHDVEAGPEIPKPGDLGFGDSLDQEIERFRQHRAIKLQSWAKGKGLSSAFRGAANGSQELPTSDQDDFKNPKTAREKRAAQKLHLILYIEYLLISTAKATLEIVRFAESKAADGTMRKKRFIFPPANTLMKWIRGFVKGEDSSPDVDGLDNVTNNVQTIYVGDCLKEPKDPEHLPPKNIGQVLGNYIRKVPEFLGSDPVKFGLRVTVATMSIGIMAFLKNSHAFFIAQRVVWALVMIAIGMNPTSGSAVFNLLGNLTATLVAMIFSYINWYIVDQKTAGIVVFLFIFMMIYFYFCAKYPRFLVAIAAGAITHVLIVGYELQVRVIGLKIATATGQEYYPIYELAPFRLLVVAGGVTVAYFWTIFPVPIMERSVLRRDLGGSLFVLARYLSVVSSTVEQRLQDKEGQGSLKSSPGRKLEKMRHKLLNQEIALLASMRQNLALIAWEPSLGGEFPRDTYESLVAEVQNMVNYLTVVAYASNAFVEARSDSSASSWLAEFSRERLVANRTSHKVTSLLALLSASISNSQALPPYLKTPKSFHISDQLKGTTLDIINPEHINESGYRAFAAIEAASSCLIDSTENIVRLVRELVGELDFSFQIANSSANSNSDLSADSEKGKKKLP